MQMTIPRRIRRLIRQAVRIVLAAVVMIFAVVAGNLWTAKLFPGFFLH